MPNRTPARSRFQVCPRVARFVVLAGLGVLAVLAVLGATLEAERGGFQPLCLATLQPRIFLGSVHSEGF